MPYNLRKRKVSLSSKIEKNTDRISEVMETQLDVMDRVIALEGHNRQMSYLYMLGTVIGVASGVMYLYFDEIQDYLQIDI